LENKAAQVYYLLNQTVYFEVRGEQLVLKEGKYSFTETATRLDRSLNEKYQYFVKQEVKKTPGFELHHVVPLAWSESIHHFKMLDKWEIWFILTAFKSCKNYSKTKNKNVILEVVENDNNFI